jgi:hypothetical protein
VLLLWKSWQLFDNLPKSHGECVNIFIELIQQIDALNDHVISLVNVELNLGSAVAVTQTELSLAEIAFLQGTLLQRLQ